jgi:hypothetical protein
VIESSALGPAFFPLHPCSPAPGAPLPTPTQVNVFVLGGVYLQLVELLRLTNSPALSKPVDPSLFLHRFTEALPLGDRVGGLGIRGEFCCVWLPAVRQACCCSAGVAF